MFKRILFLALLSLILPANLLAANYTYDLGLSQGDVSFSESLVAGQKIRIYAAIHNNGSKDVAGYVTFYQSNVLIGDSQTISVRSGGLADEVYVDFTVPKGSFNIRAEIRGQDPKDENSANDVTVTTLYVPEPDTDGDGIGDNSDSDDDNDGVKDINEPKLGTDPKDSDSDDDGCIDGGDDFPLNPDECVDTDGDGIGDNSDSDDDNDALSDKQENLKGTDPTNPDTDDDNVLDGVDAYPTDSNRTQKTVAVNNTNSSPTPVAESTPTPEILTDTNLNHDVIDLDNFNFQTTSNLVIKTTKKSWNTFVFDSEIRGSTDNNYVYEWNFGDGVKSNQKVVEHKFNNTGSFTVSLKVSGRNDFTASGLKNINISFFNVSNMLVWYMVIGLIFILLILLVLVLSQRARFAKK